jgi:hypothetical protein
MAMAMAMNLPSDSDVLMGIQRRIDSWQEGDF